MGIPRGTARLLLDEHRARPFSGSILELGRMSVHCTEAELRRWAAAQGVTLAAARGDLSHDPRLARLGCLGDRGFFGLLGFSRVVSCDASAWEGAEVIADLNRELPAELRGRFDVVFEAGTIQHVFNLPQVLANIHAALAPGGRVIHGMAPSHNHVDHGFWMFSPTLFHDFYSANGWRIESEFFFEFFPFWHRGRFHSSRWAIRRYTPGCLDHLAYGGFRARQVGLFVVATKVDGARADRIPQQSWYERFWTEREARPASEDLTSSARPGALARAVDHFYLPAKQLWRRLVRLGPRRLPPVVARY